MSSKNRKHVHKYRQVEISGDKVWACGLPECHHYMPHHMRNLIPGKASICWECGESFVLDARALALDMPVCINCIAPTSDEVNKKLDGLDLVLSTKCIECKELNQVIGSNYCEHCIVFHGSSVME